MYGPKSTAKYPFEGLSYITNYKRCVFIKNVVTRKNILVGEYSYYDDPGGADDFENSNVLYHYEFSKEKLIIGKFCALAEKTKFIMSSANHKLDGFSTYPFCVFANGWEKKMDAAVFPNKGDTVVGNDVWFGYNSTIMPGITIGDGSIIGSNTVVAKDVPPYSVVCGNPGKVIKRRFNEEIIKELLEIKWWDWDIKKITENIPFIISNDIEKLKNL